MHRTAGTITNGQTVCVRHTSSASFNTGAQTALTIGGVLATFSSTTLAQAADTTPDAYTFASQADVARATMVTSAAATINGINAATAVVVTGGEYSIGCTATFTTGAGTISNGQTICVRHTSAAGAGASTSTTLTVGGVVATFTSTTSNSGTGGGGALNVWMLLLLACLLLARLLVTRGDQLVLRGGQETQST
jgi:hypothetical protein